MSNDPKALQFRNKETGGILRLCPNSWPNFVDDFGTFIALSLNDVELINNADEIETPSDSLRNMIGQDMQNIQICFAPIPVPEREVHYITPEEVEKPEVITRTRPVKRSKKDE